MPGWLIRLVIFWDAWMIRVVILYSFAAHVALVFTCRRRKATGRKTLIVWLAYTSAQWAPTYALGKLSIGSTNQWLRLVTIWAALLLFHAAGPDNISSYSLEDNILSWRQVLELVLQVFGALYILYKNVYVLFSVWSSGGGFDTIGLISSAILVMGIIKYGERVFAQRGAELEKMRSSSKKKVQKKKLRKIKMQMSNEQILLVAQDLLHITKGAFVDNMTYEYDADKQEIILPKTWNEILYNVVDMELSLMYDILYTKAAVVHTWFGYGTRFTSPFITTATFFLFWSHSKESLQQPDVFITYILLGFTVILDFKWLLRAVASTWTYSFLNDKPHCWLHHSLLCSKKWRLIRRYIVSLDPMTLLFCKEPTSYRRWSGIIGQYNLFDECTGDGLTWKLKVFKWLAERASFDDQWMEYRYYNSKGFRLLSYLYQSSCVRNKLFESIWEFLKLAYPPIPPLPHKKPMALLPKPKEKPKTPPTWPEPQQFIDRELEETMDFAPAFQQTILIWHITTDIFLLMSDEYESPSPQVRAIKVVSNYMAFLVAVRPSMLPGLKLRSLYEGALEALKTNMDNQQSSCNSTERMKNLAQGLIHKEKEADPLRQGIKLSSYRPGYSSYRSSPPDASKLFGENIILSDGTKFALVLLGWVSEKYDNIDIHIKIDKKPSYRRPEDRYKRLKDLIPELENLEERRRKAKPDDDPLKFISRSDMLDYIFIAWVRLLMYASVRCTRDSHAKQLAFGGEFTTIAWILNEHAGIFRIQKDNEKV
uniref:DUF4220 domain-containing protein n=1 Tax=Leersia perrieri TaxID=77586 RepID=A0A0D9W239_9ORYZ